MRRSRLGRKRPGHHLVTCELSGWKCWDDEVMETWDGMIVHKDFYEERHPQDFVRGGKDDQSVSPLRSAPPVTYVQDTHPNGVTFGEPVTLTHTMIVGQAGRDTSATVDDSYGFLQTGYGATEVRAPVDYGWIRPNQVEGKQIYELSVYPNIDVYTDDVTYESRVNAVVMDFGEQHGNYGVMHITLDQNSEITTQLFYNSYHKKYFSVPDNVFAQYMNDKKVQNTQHGQGTIVTFEGEVGEIVEDAAITAIDDTTDVLEVESVFESDIDAFTCNGGAFTADSWQWELLSADEGISIVGSSTSETVTISATGDPGTYNFYLKQTATDSTTGCVLITYSDQLSQTIVAALYWLPLLTNRWENGVDGTETNHAVMTATSTSRPHTGADGTTDTVNSGEMRFAWTQRTEPADGYDYGNQKDGVKYAEYNSETPRGLMVYDGTNNRIPQSQNFHNGQNRKGASTISTTATSPQGTNDAVLLDFSSGTIPDSIKYFLTGDMAGDTTYTVWMKKGTATHMRIGLSNGGIGSPNWVTDKVALTDDWVRYEVVCPFSAETYFYRFFIASDATGLVDDPDCHGTFYWWGEQATYEAAYTDTPSYLATFGSAATSTDETCIVDWPVTEVNDFIIKFDWTPTYDGSYTLMESGTFKVDYNGTNLSLYNGAGQAWYTMTPAPYTTYAIQCTFDSVNGITISIDGITASNATTADLIPSATLSIGHAEDGTRQIDGMIKNIVFAALF